MLRRNEWTGSVVRRAVDRPGTRARGARPAPRRRARRARRRVGGGWRSGRRQDGAARLRGRGCARVSDRPDVRGRGGDGAPVRSGSAAVFPVRRADGPSPAAAERGAWRRVRTHHGARAESVLAWIGGPRPVVRGGRGAAAKQPLMAVVDDAHWLDHASARTLAFV